MQIRIALDGSFMSLAAAKAKTTADHKARITVLKKDLAIATKYDALKSTVGILGVKIKAARAAKKAGTLLTLRNKRDNTRAKMKELKATLSSPAHVNLQKISLQIKKANTAFDKHKNPENFVSTMTKKTTPLGRPKGKVGTRSAGRKPGNLSKAQKRDNQRLIDNAAEKEARKSAPGKSGRSRTFGEVVETPRSKVRR